MPTVSIEVMNLALAEFARDVNPEAKKQIVLLVDRAGFHTSKAVRVPAGIEKVLVNRCQWFSKNWDIVQPHVGFQWICEIEKQYESS